MEAGERSSIVDAIAAAEHGTTGEIRVHLSRRRFERDTLESARAIFARHGMGGVSVLIYVNLRSRRFALVGGASVDKVIGGRGWQALARELGERLRGTHHERAVAQTVGDLGALLGLAFPRPRAD